MRSGNSSPDKGGASTGLKDNIGPDLINTDTKRIFANSSEATRKLAFQDMILSMTYIYSIAHFSFVQLYRYIHPPQKFAN